MDTEIDKPGVDGQEFRIIIGPHTGVDLVIGEDIIIVSEPEPVEDGYKWSFKCVSEKALKYLNDICK